MTTLERRMLTLAVLFGVLTAGVVAGRWVTGRPQAAQAYTGSFYGANESWVAAAAMEWPQRVDNYCGIATIEVVANYTYQMTGGQNYFPFRTGGQQKIANDLNSAAGVSQWGTPAPDTPNSSDPTSGIGPGFGADIARDGGTDPRSLAWGILYESAAGYYLHLHHGGYLPPRWATTAYSFHNVIYEPPSAGAPASQFVGVAITGLARALERYHMPISVTVAHGLHSVVVSGVYSTNDPITSSSANVDAVNVWDPGVGSPWGGYQASREVTWDNYTFNTSKYMWGSTYSWNSGYDPDPAVGIYTPNSTYPWHWIGTLTDVEPDTKITVSPDYAIDGQGNVLQHP